MGCRGKVCFRRELRRHILRPAYVNALTSWRYLGFVNHVNRVSFPLRDHFIQKDPNHSFASLHKSYYWRRRGSQQHLGSWRRRPRPCWFQSHAKPLFRFSGSVPVLSVPVVAEGVLFRAPACSAAGRASRVCVGPSWPGGPGAGCLACVRTSLDRVASKKCCGLWCFT